MTRVVRGIGGNGWWARRRADRSTREAWYETMYRRKLLEKQCSLNALLEIFGVSFQDFVKSESCMGATRQCVWLRHWDVQREVLSMGILCSGGGQSISISTVELEHLDRMHLHQSRFQQREGSGPREGLVHIEPTHQHLG